jgi:hypothetical protein
MPETVRWARELLGGNGIPLDQLDRDLVDQIFDFQIRDFSGYAIALHG